MNDPVRTSATPTEDASAPLVSGLLDDVVELKREVTQLRAALAGRPSVEQAKGMLMLAYSYGPDRAATVLSGWAADLGVSPQAVAERMVEAIDTAVDGEGPGGPRLSVVPTQRRSGT